MINYSKYKRDCLSFLQRLIQTPSVNGRDNESSLVRIIRGEANELGLSSTLLEKEKDRPNIFIGKNFSSNKNLLLVAHTDTVSEGETSAWQHPPFSARVIGGKIYGRGVVDCKGGIAVSLYTLKILKDINKEGFAKFVGVVDEESGADSKLGLAYLLNKGLKAKAAVYTYGSVEPVTHVIIGHRGLIRLWVTCIGEGTHAGSSDWQDRRRGENAINGVADFVKELEKLEVVATSKYFPKHKVTFTPTILEGGVGESIVPDKAKVLVDIRTLPNTSNNQIIEKVVGITKKISRGKRRFDVETKTSIPAAITNPNCDFVKLAQRLTNEIYNVKTKLRGSGPANESYMLITKRIPTIVGYGLTGGGFHSPNEYADIDSVEKSLKFLTQLALGLS